MNAQTRLQRITAPFIALLILVGHQASAGGESTSQQSAETSLLGNQSLPGSHRVYNLEVRTAHTYAVSPASVLVHNQNSAIKPLILGIRSKGLDKVAEHLGGVIISADNPAWQQAFEQQLASGRRIMVNLDGFKGEGVYNQVMGAAGQAMRTPGVGGTRWEMMRLFESGRLEGVEFFSGSTGEIYQNPFAQPISVGSSGL